MGKKYTPSQQKYRAKQRAVTERIKREEAAAAVAEKEANPHGSLLLKGESDRAKPEQLSPSRHMDVASDTESTIATPDTPVNDSASRHLAAAEGYGSTDKSDSDSADSEPADPLRKNSNSEECQMCQLNHVTDSGQDEEAALSTLPLQQPIDAAEPADLANIESNGLDNEAVPTTTGKEISEVSSELTDNGDMGVLNNGKVNLPESVPLHACSLLQAWTPKWVAAQVNMAVFATINVTAVIAAVVEYRKRA